MRPFWDGASPGNAPTRSDRATPLAWEKALREAPATGSKLVQVADHLGIRVTFPARSFGRVAQLIRMRSRRVKLERIGDHFEEARLARDRRLALTPHLQLLQHALDATAGDRKSGSRFVRGSAEHLNEKTALAFYRWSHHPDRAVNVIVGGFDLGLTKNVLNVVFREKVDDAPMPRSKQTTAAPIQPAKPAIGDTLMVSCPLPTHATPGLELLLEVVAGGDDAFLPDFLRAAGHPRIVVRSRRVHTDSGEVWLLQVTSPGVRLDPKHRLVQRVEAALAQLISKPAAEVQMQRAISVVRSRRAALLASQEGLAELLAGRWIDSGVTAPRLDANGRLIDHDNLSGTALKRLAAEILDPKRRAVSVEVAK